MIAVFVILAVVLDFIDKEQAQYFDRILIRGKC